jgi:hypothetical protein
MGWEYKVRIWLCAPTVAFLNWANAFVGKQYIKLALPENTRFRSQRLKFAAKIARMSIPIVVWILAFKASNEKWILDRCLTPLTPVPPLEFRRSDGQVGSPHRVLFPEEQRARDRILNQRMNEDFRMIGWIR